MANNKNLYFGLTVVVLLLFFFCVLFFTVEAPVADDPQVVTGHTARFIQAENPVDKFYWLAAQNAEHRMLTTRLYGLFSITVFDFLSIQFLITVGAFILFAIVIFLYRFMSKEGLAKPCDLLVFSLLLLTPAYWASASSGWGTSNFGSILFPLLGLVTFFHAGRFAWLGFEVFTVLAIFTQTNGWFMAPLGVFLLLLNKPNNYKKYLVIHLLLSWILFEIYFYRYDHQEQLRALGWQNVMAEPLMMLGNYLLWVLVWIGQWIVPLSGFEHNWQQFAVVLSALSGLLMLALFGLLLYRSRFHYKKPSTQLLIAMLILLLSSIVLGSFGRSLFLPYKFALSDRYTFYSILIVIFLLALMLSLKRFSVVKEGGLGEDKKFGQHGIYLAFAVIYCVINYGFSYQDLWQHRNKHLMCVELWQAEGEAKPCLWHGDNGADMKLAARVGILKITPGILANNAANSINNH